MCIRDRGSLAPAMYNAKSSTYREKLTVGGIEVTISLNPRANSSTLKTLPCGTPSSRVKWRDRIEAGLRSPSRSRSRGVGESVVLKRVESESESESVILKRVESESESVIFKRSESESESESGSVTFKIVELESENFEMTKL